MPGDYPVMLDVRSCRVVIVGGGMVATRKAAGLLAAGATAIVVVSPTFDAAMPAEVERVVAVFEPSQLDGARLVFAATDRPEVNAAVAAAARERNLFVNRADGDAAGEQSDFAGMATHRDGAITLAVSAAGNPAVAARVRDELARLLPRPWAELATLAVVWRPKILNSGATAESRTAALRLLASSESADRLQSDGEDALRRKIEQTLGQTLK